MSGEHEGTPPERLAALRLDGAVPLIVGFGSMVDDSFVGLDYSIAAVDVVLWRMLRAEGFQRIVFNGHGHAVYFLDEDSRRLTRPEPVPAAAQQSPATAATPPMRHVRGPAGDVRVIGRPAALAADSPPPAPDSPSDTGVPAPHLIPLRLDDEAAVTLMAEVMRPSDIRTALVFVHAEEWLRHMRADRSFAAASADWVGGGTGNVVVMLFKQPSLAEVHRFVVGLRLYPRLENHLAGLGRTPDGALEFGPPPRAELERLIHRARLRRRHRLVIGDWLGLDALTIAMAGRREPVRAWARRLDRLAAERTPLSAAECRGRGWIPLLTAPTTSALERLDAMTGLAPVKEQLRRLALAAKKDRELSRAGGRARAIDSLHLVFQGNPGTGKTMVARLVAEIYRELGLLSSGHLVEAEVSELVAGHVGGTAQLVADKVAEARGGVLFIDEAHRLSDQLGGFGREAIQALISQMENARDDLAVIVAGYPSKMEEFLRSDPGLRSRLRRVVDFPDYTADELFQILLAMLDDKGIVERGEQVETELRELVGALRAAAVEGFGNAREMRSLADDLFTEWAVRTAESTDGAGGTDGTDGTDGADPRLDSADIPARYRSRLTSRAVPALAELLEELDTMVGLESVKQIVRQEVARLRRDQLRRDRGDRVGAITAPNMLFLGPPGTGKTTVARLIGRIFAALGLLGSGHTHEVSRADLVGQYVGQTAPRTRDAVDRALGGVLFIDEAYSLAPRGAFEDPFGTEAITELNKAMEDHHGKLVVIAAGYTADMEDFVRANPGRESWFTARVGFPAYDTAKRIEIRRRSGAGRGFVLTSAAETRAAAVLERRRLADPATFGNARAVRRLLEQMEGRQAHRVMAGPPEADLSTFEAEDVPGD